MHGSRPASEHAVRFYDGEEELLDEVAEFLDAGLRSGGYAVAIATADHLAELKRRLVGFGGRPATEQGRRLILLDAQETLDAFMVDGHPDRGRFEAHLIPIITRGPQNKPLHAFGEMVAILCERDQYEATIALEELWNRLVRSHHFSLFCAYPRRLFASKERSRAFQHVCGAHHSVLNLVDDGADEDGDLERSLVRARHRNLALEVELQRSREAQ
jgi:hypothetical protein